MSLAGSHPPGAGRAKRGRLPAGGGMSTEPLPTGRPPGWPRWGRDAGSAVAVLPALIASGVIGYGVFAPAETVVPAPEPYPDRPAITPARYGELGAAPLIVDGRLRVH